MAEVIEQSGSLVDSSKATGVAIERMARLRAVFAEAGSGADQVMPVFAKMEKALYDASQGGGKSAEAIQRLGLSVDGLLQMSPDERLLATAKAIGGIEDSTARAGLVMEIFGKSGIDLLQVFDALADTTRTDRALGKLPSVLARNAEVLDVIGDGFSQLKLKSQQFFVGVLDQVAPTIDRIVQGFAGIDLTAAGQKAGAFVAVAMDYWKAGKFDEFIGLTIEAGFELGRIGAMRVWRSMTAIMGGQGLWTAIANGLLTAVNGIARSLTEVVMGLAVPFMALGDYVQSVFIAAFAAVVNSFGSGLETVINKTAGGLNRTFGTSLKGVIFSPVEGGSPSLAASLDRAMEARADVVAAAGRFFGDSTQAGRNLLGIVPTPEDQSALTTLTDRMRKILAAREAAADAEGQVAAGLRIQVPIVNILAQLRRDEAAALARLTELERERAMIEGNFRINDAQKYAQKLAILRQERAEIERIIALLQERAAAPGLTEQEREQIAQRVDQFQGRLGSVNTAIGTIGADPNSVSDQFAASITGLENQFGTTAQAIARSFTSVIGTAVDSVSGGLQKLIGDTEYWSSRLGAVAGPIMGALTGAITRMFTEWIAKRALMAAKNMFWSAKEGAVDATAKAPGAILTSISSFGVAAAVGLAAVVAAVAAFGGFAQGGYTGDMPANQVAGVVHGREYVFDAASVSRIGLDNLEAIRAGHGAQGAARVAPMAAAPTEVHLAAFDTREDARKWAGSQDAEVWFVDMAKRTAHLWRSS
jgi:hypothetical protein